MSKSVVNPESTNNQSIVIHPNAPRPQDDTIPALPPTLTSVHDLPILPIPDDNIEHTNSSGIVFSDAKLKLEKSLSRTHIRKLRRKLRKMCKIT